MAPGAGRHALGPRAEQVRGENQQLDRFVDRLWAIRAQEHIGPQHEMLDPGQEDIFLHRADAESAEQKGVERIFLPGSDLFGRLLFERQFGGVGARITEVREQVLNAGGVLSAQG